MLKPPPTPALDYSWVLPRQSHIQARTAPRPQGTRAPYFSSFPCATPSHPGLDSSWAPSQSRSRTQVDKTPRILPSLGRVQTPSHTGARLQLGSASFSFSASSQQDTNAAKASAQLDFLWAAPPRRSSPAGFLSFSRSQDAHKAPTPTRQTTPVSGLSRRGTDAHNAFTPTRHFLNVGRDWDRCFGLVFISLRGKLLVLVEFDHSACVLA
ncbi:hypothetical protein C8R43DRAFT_1142397 [Mycena crocata]|nr:hypothetical protein C8R43DRAFT_1142397 [Mycena crocata]